MRTRAALTRTAVAASVSAALVGASAGPVGAWPMPLTATAGGACLADGTRQPVVLVVTNLESAFPNSPATIDNVTVVPGFPRTEFDPQPLPNTGSAHATSTVTVPGNWTGNLTFSYRMFWDGPDGSDIRVGSGSIQLAYCFPEALNLRLTRASRSQTIRLAAAPRR